MKNVFFVLCLCALLSSSSVILHGEETETLATSPEVTAEVSAKEVNVGDRIKLDVTFEKASGYEVSFPEKPENLGDFSLIESKPTKSGWGKSEKKGYQYVIAIYETGAHVVPPIPLKYRKVGETEWRSLDSPQVPIEVVSLLKEGDTDIKDLKGLIPYGMGASGVLFILVIAFLLIAIAYWIWQQKNKKKFPTEAERIKSAYEIAYERLMKLKKEDLTGQGRINEYYIRLSDIVRHYLEDRFAFRAPEMTTEEFMIEIKKSPKVLGEHRELLKDFLSHCDMVKFAKYGPTPIEMLDSFHSAEKLLDKTRPQEEEEEE